MKNIYKSIVTGVLTLALVLVAVPHKAQAVNLDLFGTLRGTPATGVESASSTALDTNLATNLAGESAFFNRLMTLLFNCTPVSTTTDSTVVGQSNLAWYFISGQSASSSIAFYDGLLNTGVPAIAEWGIPASTTVTAFPQRITGTAFNTGIFADITGTLTLNYCYNNAN